MHPHSFGMVALNEISPPNRTQREKREPRRLVKGTAGIRLGQVG